MICDMGLVLLKEKRKEKEEMIVCDDRNYEGKVEKEKSEVTRFKHLRTSSSTLPPSNAQNTQKTFAFAI